MIDTKLYNLDFRPIWKVFKNLGIKDKTANLIGMLRFYSHFENYKAIIRSHQGLISLNYFKNNHAAQVGCAAVS